MTQADKLLTFYPYVLERHRTCPLVLNQKMLSDQVDLRPTLDVA